MFGMSSDIGIIVIFAVYTKDFGQMKRIIYILIAAAAFAACDEELTLDPAISFFSSRPEIVEDKAIFRLAYANITDSTERVFPVIFEGTAEKGIDYLVSGDRFIFGGENPVDSIVVTALKLGTDKTLNLSVEVPEGYVAGKYITSGFTLPDKLAYFSFAKDYLMMTDSLEISFTANDRSGKRLNLTSDAEVSLTVNKEKSTAEEGVDFAFSDSTRFIIAGGQNTGSLEIRSLNPNPKDGKDKIVLNINFNEKYSIGETAEVEISLLDTVWRHLDGSWNIDTLVTDSLYMDRYWNGVCTAMDKLPKYNERDKFTVNMKELFLSPSFRSGFDDYFSSTSDLRKGTALRIDLGDGTSADLQTFWLDDTNRYFSPDQKSEDKESLIGLRFFPNNTDSLDMYIIDYTSKSFMPELESTGKYAPEKPVAASPGLFFNLTFTRQ